VGPGIYFLEAYDPGRIPVLFVHGALGSPQDFASLIDRLDRGRYQPWVFFYPSGARLSGVSDLMSQLVTRLRLRLGLRALVVVAHSMGGLVARSFILKHHDQAREDPVKLFVAISTPWGGVESAELGAHSPIVVPSWRDLAPTSEFLHRLFFEDSRKGPRPRRLPPGLAFHLIFGVLDPEKSLASAVRWEAVREAADRWPLAYGHDDILESPEARTVLGEILTRELGE
jgi:pimeloyl-ACP methyl ester carboxylesterase